jgi:hypothetical protein
VVRFSHSLDLGRTEPDRGWDLVRMIIEVIASQPAWASLKIVLVRAETAQGVTASFETLEEARAWAHVRHSRLHRREHLDSEVAA